MRNPIMQNPAETRTNITRNSNSIVPASHHSCTLRRVCQPRMPASYDDDQQGIDQEAWPYTLHPKTLKQRIQFS